MNKQLLNVFKGLWMVVKFFGSASIVISLVILGTIFAGGVFTSMGLISPQKIVYINWTYGIACFISMSIVSLLLSKFAVYLKNTNKTVKYYSMYCEKLDLFIKPDIMNGFIFTGNPHFFTIDEINRIKHFSQGDYLMVSENKINRNQIDIIKYKSTGVFYKHFVDNF